MVRLPGVLPASVSSAEGRQAWRCSSHRAESAWRSDSGSPPSRFSPHWSAKTNVTAGLPRRPFSWTFKRLTCFSVVVTGFALFLCFRCLFATWKTVLVFFPFCLFFPISPEENTSTEASTASHLKTLCTWSLWVQVLNLHHHSDTLEHTHNNA